MSSEISETTLIDITQRASDTESDIDETFADCRPKDSLAFDTFEVEPEHRINRKEFDEHFQLKFRSAHEAIAAGVHPKLIPEGSSGSYFVPNKDGKIVGVFKPSDEEPFATLNPKWPKFFQRMLCFCCFGRACLVPNTGYLSEAGASIVDEMLQLHVVPTTRVVKLASPAFFYSRFCGVAEVRPKQGSFQLFVEGYESATAVFARWNYDSTLLSEQEEKRFTVLFQKMCVVDYVIRNTDRHLDNLLIRHVPGKEIEVAVIDNGLAFPVKHPECTSRFRTFPFRWGQQKWAQVPWDPALREHLITLITPAFVHELCYELKTLFQTTHSSSKYLITNQMRVLRGQLWNLREALEKNETPEELSQREPITANRKYRNCVPDTLDWNTWFRSRPLDYVENLSEATQI